MWDKSAESVNSNVLTMEISKCDKQSRRKRSTPLTPEVPYDVTLPAKTIQAPPLLINTTAKDGYKMIYHTMNVSFPLKAVIATVTPIAENDTFEVYVHVNDRPTPLNYLEKFVIPKPENETTEVTGISEEELQKTLHTLHISANTLMNYTNKSAEENYVFVGVKKLSPGIKFIIHVPVECAKALHLLT